MSKNYAIMRFIKVKAAGCGGIEKHNERQKEKYQSNPDIDSGRTHLNYHLVKPDNSYRSICQRRIEEAQVKRVRKDAVYMVETIITASNDFINQMDKSEQRAYFEWALKFYEKEIGKENIISAVVHMDEKTPHMHLSFVPITKDNRLSAKDIIGNKKKLCNWQDKYYEHMTKKYPDMERGKPAITTGRAHISTEMLKRLERHDKKRIEIMKDIENIGIFSSSDDKKDVAKKVNKYLKVHDKLVTEIKAIGENNDVLQTQLDDMNDKLRKVFIAYKGIKDKIDIIPDEVIQYYLDHPEEQKGYAEKMQAKYDEEEKSVLGRMKHRKEEINLKARDISTNKDYGHKR